MAALLYSEINILCVVLMLVIAVRASLLGLDKSVKFKVFITSVLLAAAANALDFLWNMGITGTWNIPPFLMWLIDFWYFISFGCSAFCWFLYTESEHRRIKYKSIKDFLFYSFPIVLLAVLLIISYFNGCLFYFDKNGVYHRGPLFYMQQVLSYWYILVSSVKCFARSFEKRYYSRKNEFLLLSAFVIPPLICGIIQIMFQNLPVLSVGIVISFLMACISLLEGLIVSDPLTRIPNRHELLERLASFIKSLKRGEELYFMFIDVDSFKEINDTFGHNEGDRILTEIAAALQKYAIKTNACCGRYGGDEFVIAQIITKNTDKAALKREFDACMDERDLLAGGKYPVTLSIGSEKYLGENDSIPDLIARADNDMYKIKEARKKENNLQFEIIK